MTVSDKATKLILLEQEKPLRLNDLKEAEQSVIRLLKDIPVNQNQFDALTVFCYHMTAGILEHSKLLKQIKQNPHDPSIYIYTVDKDNKPIADSCLFLKWVRKDGKINDEMLYLRAAEADLYNS